MLFAAVPTVKQNQPPVPLPLNHLLAMPYSNEGHAEVRRRRINSVKERGSHGALRSHLLRRNFSEKESFLISCFPD